MSFFAVHRNHQRRPAVSLYNPSCGNSDHPAMPTVAIDHRTECFPQQRVVGHLLLDGLHNPSLFFLTIGVELVQPERYFARWSRLLNTEQFDNFACDVHAAGSIDSWRDAKRNFARSQWLAAKLRNLKQSFQSRIYRRAQLAQTHARDHAILADQRNGISSRCTRRDLHK